MTRGQPTLTPKNKYELNGFYLSFSSKDFTAFEVDLPNPRDLRSVREQYREKVLIRWQDGIAYGLPINGFDGNDFGKPHKLSVQSYLGAKLVAWSVEKGLIDLFASAKERVTRHFPFTLLSSEKEIMSATLQESGISSNILDHFKITPSLSFEPKLIDINEVIDIGLFLNVGLQYKIETELTEFISAGINIKGRYLSKRNPSSEERRYAGRLLRIESDKVFVEDVEGTEFYLCNEVMLEGSLSNYLHCVSQIVGEKYWKFSSNKLLKESETLNGLGYEEVLTNLGNHLRKKDDIEISPDLSVSFSDRISIPKNGSKSVHQIGLVQYCYDRTQKLADTQAWRGLEQHGPYSKESIRTRNPSFLIIFPAKIQHRVEFFFKAFFDGTTDQSLAFPKGFLKIAHQYDSSRKFVQVPESYSSPTNQYKENLKQELTKDSSYDCVFIIQPNATTDDFYLECKSYVLQHGIAIQQIKERTLFQNGYSLQFTLKNLSVALYAKLGGTPWTVINDDTYNDEIVIGMGTAEVGGSRSQKRKRYVGITTVFSGDGNYLLGSASKECAYEDYPSAIETETNRILDELKRKLGWKEGTTAKIVFHCYKPLKKIEMAQIVKKCIQGIGDEIHLQFAFLTITKSHSFKILDASQTTSKYGKNHQLFPDRGTSIRIGENTRLLSVTGPQLIKPKNVPLPEPLLIHLDRDHSTFQDLGYLTEQVLKFTSLSWRSIYPVRLPATIAYSELIAESLGKLKQVPDWSQTVLSTKLKHSRWFL